MEEVLIIAFAKEGEVSFRLYLEAVPWALTLD